MKIRSNSVKEFDRIFSKNDQLFKLLRFVMGGRLSDQQFDGLILFLGNNQHPHRTRRRKGQSDPPLVGFDGIPAGADPCVNGVLYHVVAVSQQEVSELRGSPALDLRLDRQVKHD